MSDFQAIGAVSATLRTLLKDRMTLPSGIDTLKISISTPSDDDNTDDGRINLFLYRVTENPSLKDQEIPGFGHPAAYGRPPLSLDLHYLITAYGTSAEGDLTHETPAQYLLGSAMRVLHDYPIITDNLNTLNNGGVPVLDTSLLGQFEKVKICLEPLSLEDVSKVWTALALPYRLSAGYRISVVQIESQLGRGYAKPVGELPAAGPRVTVTTYSTPKIDQILVKRQLPFDANTEFTAPYARIGDTLILEGSSFIEQGLRLEIGGVSIVPTVKTEQRLTAVIPDNPALQPGVHALRLVRDITLSGSNDTRPGFYSNLTAVMLVPHITNINPINAAVGDPITISGSRLSLADKNCQTIIGDQVITPDDYTTNTDTQIVFALPQLSNGTYTVRVRVNGAESIDQQTITVP